MYAIDSRLGEVRWETKVGRPVPSDCYAASPLLGIHSTPVIDAEHRTIYVVARTCDGPSYACTNQVVKNGRFHSLVIRLRKLLRLRTGARYLVIALDASDGHRLAGWPVEIAGRPTNDPGVSFDPARHLQRLALLLLDGSIYAGFGSYCGGYPFRGWVASINVTTRRLKLWTDEAAVTDESPQAGIWGAGGLVSDGPGSILFTTGNGTLPPPGDGKSQANALGNSVVRLRVQPDGSLLATDHFTPSNAKHLNDDDLDLGTTAPALLPPVFAVDGHNHLLVQGGKAGTICLLDSQNLGGRNRGPGGERCLVGRGGTIWRNLCPPGRVARRWRLHLPGVGPIRAFRLEKDGWGAVLRVVGTTQALFGYGSGSPIITSSGTTDGSAIIWLIRRGKGATNCRRTLAVPDSNGQLQLLWQVRSWADDKLSRGRFRLGPYLLSLPATVIFLRLQNASRIARRCG